MVASGKNADFLVLDANPLDNIANTRRISRVYLRGREVDRAALRTQLKGRVCWNTSADIRLTSGLMATSDHANTTVSRAKKSGFRMLAASI